MWVTYPSLHSKNTPQWEGDWLSGPPPSPGVSISWLSGILVKRQVLAYSRLTNANQINTVLFKHEEIRKGLMFLTQNLSGIFPG